MALLVFISRYFYPYLMLTADKDLRTGLPLWRTLPFPRVPTSKLLSDLKTDIVIVGAGISGAMAAEELASIGFKVILLDKRGPLKGATSASTALLQYEIDTPLIKLQKQIGHDNAMRAWRRSKLGLSSLTEKIQSLQIKCDAKRTASLYLSGDVLDRQALQQEKTLRNHMGLHTDYLTRAELKERFGIARSGALFTHDNLSVNPLRLAAGFLLAAQAKGVGIFSPVTADAVETHRNGVVLRTAEGPTIEAHALIYATGYEMPKSVQTKRHRIYSTYAIATKPQARKLWPEKSFIWEASDPYLYMRVSPDGRVICGGTDEEFADEEKRDALLPRKVKTLERKLGQMFPQLDSKADFTWCGAFGGSTTGLPTIGKIPGMANCYAILAYGGNGITFSRIAAEILTSELNGRSDPEADLFAFA